MKRNSTLNIMRKIAFVMLLIGALGSLGLVLNEGRHTPILLLVLFVGWVLSPYFALLLISVVFKRLSTIFPVTFYRLMLLISFSSLVIYSIVLNQHMTRAAFIFIVVPFISWILMIIVMLIASSRARNLSKKAR